MLANRLFGDTLRLRDGDGRAISYFFLTLPPLS